MGLFTCSFSAHSYSKPIKGSTLIGKFDSSASIVREVAGVFAQKGPRITEAYPPGSEFVLWLLSLLPADLRLDLIHWGMSIAIGKSPRKLASFNSASLPRWCVNQYPEKKYKTIVIGSPNGGVAHLAALFRAPFLTTSYLLSFKNKIRPDDIQSYLDFGRKLSPRLIDRKLDWEVINHYDPIHDRAIIKSADLIRLRLTNIPNIYKEFISKNLANHGKIVLINCKYKWPQYKVSASEYFQVGGLGGISPEEFLTRWSIDLPLEEREESEWGCPSEFASSVKDFADERGLSLTELKFHHPSKYSLLAYRAYKLCEGVNKEEIVFDCFTYLNPYTNISTGLPGFWLPYNTEDNLQLVTDFLHDKTFKRIHLGLAPSYSQCPDTVDIESWKSLSKEAAEFNFLNVKPSIFPADPLAPYGFKKSMNRLRRLYKVFPPLKLASVDFERLTKDIHD